MNNQLIPVAPATIGSESIPTVNARDLHAFLEIGKDFSNWIKDRIESFGFVESQDFVCSPILATEGRGGHNRKDYHLTLDMAKELSMVERNAKGKQARQYFIDCERQAKALPTDSLSLFKLSLATLEEQSRKLEALEQTMATVGEQVQFMAENVRLHQWQCYELKLAVTTKVNDFHKKHGIEYKQLFPGVWNRVKTWMQVSSYTAIPAAKFDEAMAYVAKIKFTDLPDYCRLQAMGGVR